MLADFQLAKHLANADLPERLAKPAAELFSFQQAWRRGDSPDSAQLLALFAELSLDDGLAIQSELQIRLRHDLEHGPQHEPQHDPQHGPQHGGEIKQQVGWKVGLTSPRVRKAVGSEMRPFGHITRLLENGAVLPGSRNPASAAANTTTATNTASAAANTASAASNPASAAANPTLAALSIEPEMCFEIAAPISGNNFDPAQVPDHIAQVLPGFEINEKRLPPNAGLALLVADNLTNWAIVKGEGVPALPASALDEAVITVTCNGEPRFQCVAAEQVDNPYESIAALAATLHRYGKRLEPGQLVITGAYARFDLAPSDASATWRAQYSGIGEVTIAL